DGRSGPAFNRNITDDVGLNQESRRFDSQLWVAMIFYYLMKRRFFFAASTFTFTAGALLTSCSTPQTRITDHLETYQSLSPRDQALVSRGQIRTGMSQNAVWIAWVHRIGKLSVTCRAVRPKLGFI